jgi:hypothetical protein
MLITLRRRKYLDQMIINHPNEWEEKTCSMFRGTLWGVVIIDQFESFLQKSVKEIFFN